jgi:starvation-inducible DNA-binding protein
MNSAVVSNFVSTTENSKIGALGSSAVADISQELRQLLADTFTLYVKTKGFHWHITGRHFRDYHLLLDEQAEQIFAIIDDIAERARKIGGTTLHSVAEIAKYKRLSDETVSASPREMLLALAEDNARLLECLRSTHELCARCGDIGTASLVEIWIDQAERRIWFLNATLDLGQESQGHAAMPQITTK